MRPPAPVLPSYRPAYNAGSAVPVPWVSRDPKTLEPVALSSLRYRIDNLTDSVVIADWTTVSAPEPSGEVTISAALNAMSRDWRDRQINQVCFELTDTNGNVRQQLAHYELCAVFQGATN